MSLGGPIFIVGYFRSGTTLAWNFFRADDRYTCFYEPLHEYLPENLSLKPSNDPSHIGVENYWEEYSSIDTSRLLTLWKPWFGRERWRLSGDDKADDLRDYIKFLVSHSESRPVLKFVRMGHRIDWLKSNFPSATIINVVRNPRDVWLSICGGSFEDGGRNERHGFISTTTNILSELGFLGPHDSDLYEPFFRMCISEYSQAMRNGDEIWFYDEIVGDTESWFVNSKYASSFFEDVKFVSKNIHVNNSQKCRSKNLLLRQEVSVLANFSCSLEKVGMASNSLESLRRRHVIYLEDCLRQCQDSNFLGNISFSLKLLRFLRRVAFLRFRSIRRILWRKP